MSSRIRDSQQSGSGIPYETQVCFVPQLYPTIRFTLNRTTINTPPPAASTEAYKSAKTTSNGHRSSRQAHVQDDPEDNNDDIEAGPAPPPEDDEDEGDYGPAAPPPDDFEEEDGDDEEGRFFGGGISKREKEVLDFIDAPGGTAADDPSIPDKIDLPWLKKTALNFEKRISKNAELRARHEDDPSKFIDSEADLDASIRALSILGEHAELYPEFARLGCVGSLVSLLAHENTDIAITAVEIIAELTDEDVSATEDQWTALVDGLLDADLLGLLVSNLTRLNEDSEEADREGVYHALEVIENLCSRSETAETIGKDKALLKWLLQRAQRVEKPNISQNKQYAAEILAILVQSAPSNRERLAAGVEDIDFVDALLQLVAPYRKRDPAEKGGYEEEYLENLFEALTCIVDSPLGKTKFVEAEGVELCLIMLKEGGKLSKAAALRLLDHAAGGSTTGALTGARDVCLKIVEAGGLKATFSVFMSFAKKQKDKDKAKSGQAEASRLTTEEHLIGIFAWMLRLLPADSPERIRTLAKFVEKDYEKTARLVTLRREHAARIGVVDAQIEAEKQAMRKEPEDTDDEEWYLRRLEAGLFTLQTIDVILAWLVAEDDGARKKIIELLADRDETLAVIKATIDEQIEGINTETEEGKDTKEMLVTLAGFLQ